MKSLSVFRQLLLHLVAPLVGAWIEIFNSGYDIVPIIVAPLVGAWIEICIRLNPFNPKKVAPLVGAWIEIANKMFKNGPGSCRSPRGSVD